MITISTGLAAAVAQWADSESDRDLDVVVFRDDQIIATDAHRLVILPCKTDGLTLGIQRAHLLAAVAAQDVLARDGQPSTIRHDLIDNDDGEGRWMPPDARGARELRITAEGTSVLISLSASVTLRCPSASLECWPYDAVKRSAAVTRPARSAPPHEYAIDPCYLYAIDQVNRAMCAGAGTRGVRVEAWQADARGPMRFSNDHGATFVIMPMPDPASPELS